MRAMIDVGGRRGFTISNGPLNFPLVDISRCLKDPHLLSTFMGWWPFNRRRGNSGDDNPHMRGSRMWLIDLQEACEREYQNPASGKAKVRELQVEWTEAHTRGEISDELLEGLDRRAFRLIRSDSEEWLRWLDDIEFWKPGWRGDEGVPTTD